MVSYDPKSWWGLIFRFHKSDTFRMLLPAMTTMAVLSAGVAWLAQSGLIPPFKGTASVHSLLGFVISLLLVFRTNTAYERWWEGRRHWGALVNASRNLALKLNAALDEGHAARPAFARLIGAYAGALKDHLRSQPGRGHEPNRVAAELFRETERLYRRGDLDLARLLSLNPDLTAFTDICGACERIRNTPIPYSYSLFLKKFIFAYIVSMPFCFADSFGYWTVPFVCFVFYVLGSLELIAEEIENPFGDDANDLPTDRIAANIGSGARDILLGNVAG
ncbi:MAG TPA: bestrophin family ion channel [Methylococcaceae bacterium]|nr:bestrophin family ion channel [Methylococcaceae bacterium]